ncbi:MAG: type IV toxin-antitoxin system AbiEi family antitoxin domain-containing protein [Actinomycetes bacterium]
MDVARVLADMGGFATYAGLRRSGVTRHHLLAALDQGRVVRLRRGVYGLGMPEGVEALTAAAVALRAVVSHDSAAVLWDLEMVHQPDQRVSVARDHSRARYPGVLIHRADVGNTEVRRGLRVTTPLRTVLDCARVLPVSEAVVIADSAMRKGLVTVDELRAAAARTRGKNAPPVRRMARMVDPKSGSVLESLIRVLLLENGLAPDETQWVVRDDRGHAVARVDFVWPRARLVVEADGFEFHRERSDYRTDRRRANAFCRLDWRLLRFSWEDVRFDPDYVVDAVRHELAKTVPTRSRRHTSTQKAA